MELLLNLCWLLLTVPAFYCWVRRRNRAESRPYIIIIALTCLLTLLFPVISASDDLHAMRPEMEDSSATKRALKQAGVDKASAQNPFRDASPQVVSFVTLPPRTELGASTTEPHPLHPSVALSYVEPLRGPPPSRLS